MLVNDTHKKAVKASLGLLVGTRGHTPRAAAMVVQRAQEHLGLLPGDLSSLSAKTKYALGVYRAGEKSSNRRWANYPREVNTLVAQIGDCETSLFDGWYCA